MNKMKIGVLALAVAFSLCAREAWAVLLLDSLPGGTTYGDLAMNRNDDGSSNLLSLPFPVNFYGNTFNSFYVNNNGNLTFEDPLWAYTPTAFPVTNQPMIAPFWGDVDTRGGDVNGGSLGNNVYVSAPNSQTVVATWHDVGYYGQNTDKLNNFQVVLRDRSDVSAGDFDIEFRYEQLEWTTGDASGGWGGLGGTPAQAGFDAGDGTNYFMIPGSRTAEVLDLVDTSNVSQDTPGLWSFAVRNGTPPGSTPDNPLMPVTIDEGFNFNFNINLNQQVFIDPLVAIGYDFVVNSGPNFQSFLLPDIGDGLYDLYLWDGLDFVLDTAGVAEGVWHDFGAGGVDRFRILGIEIGAGLDPNDPTAFVTGLTFTGAGIVDMDMLALTADTGVVPEPGLAVVMLGMGLMGIIGYGYSRRRRAS